MRLNALKHWLRGASGEIVAPFPGQIHNRGHYLPFLPARHTSSSHPSFVGRNTRVIGDLYLSQTVQPLRCGPFDAADD